MKVEMGESLFYSWLRHVKQCQIVQSNWKASSQWPLRHQLENEALMQASDAFFYDKYGYRIYKKNSSLPQLLKQGEIDVLGISIQDTGYRIYAVDVAFHEDGLNYGNREKTVTTVIKKYFRAVMSLYGYFDIKEGQIIFASPKIHMCSINDITPCLPDIDALLKEHGLDFEIRLISNGDFKSQVLDPILIASRGISDSSELFLRSYQLYKMFS
jgi:hypothetical protein